MPITDTLLRSVTISGFVSDADLELTQELPTELTPVQPGVGVMAFTLRFYDADEALVAGTADVQILNVRGGRVAGAPPDLAVPPGRMLTIDRGYGMQLTVRVTAITSATGVRMDISWSDFS